MKFPLQYFLFSFVIICSFFSCKAKEPVSEKDYIFFLHNRFLEEDAITDNHPEYGHCEYYGIINRFKSEKFVVISEIRKRNTDVKEYATKVAHQVDSLLKRGVAPNHITVIGTSKGSVIAWYVSTFLKNKDLNFVFIGDCNESLYIDMPDVRFYGNILSIYERSDSLGRTCEHFRNNSQSTIGRYKELELNTGMKHGFLYKAHDLWMQPAMRWARRDYELAPQTGIAQSIDSLIEAKTDKPFSGVVIITQNGITKYAKCFGYSDVYKQTFPKLSDQFVIGSVSKQITAVILLREYDKGRVDLQKTVHYYLPELKYTWADSVTVHQLLTHTHGIDEDHPERPLKFKPGTQYEYSQIGMELLAKIAERVAKKSFVQLCSDLFKLCDMPNTCHPDQQTKYPNLVKGYIKRHDSLTVVPESTTFGNTYVAAGGFVSTVYDLDTWNQCLHNGKLLKPATYKLMMTMHKNAIRQHPIFGPTHYGYGITVDTAGGILKLGQTGYAPGFISMCYYYPANKTSVIVLDNRINDAESLSNAFNYHIQILKIIKDKGFK